MLRSAHGFTHCPLAITGNPSIDYFISAEVMEEPNRTALSDEDEPYSEQVSESLPPQEFAY